MSKRGPLIRPMHEPQSRRRFMTVAAAVIAGVDVGFAGSWSALAQTSLSPDAALTQLLDGNRRFVDKRLTSFQDDLTILQQNSVEKQEPFAAVLSCSDSRVPVELIFDQTIGHIFVARVAGNVASAEVIASLEYGVAVLGTAVLMVMGHGGCGAVKAAIGGKAVPGQISALYRYIRPAIDEAGADLDAATMANARIQAKLLRESSPVIAERVAQGTLQVVASQYDLATGKVTILKS
jgi:carbonic anhydrase